MGAPEDYFKTRLQFPRFHCASLNNRSQAQLAHGGLLVLLIGASIAVNHLRRGVTGLLHDLQIRRTIRRGLSHEAGTQGVAAVQLRRPDRCPLDEPFYQLPDRVRVQPLTDAPMTSDAAKHE